MSTAQQEALAESIQSDKSQNTGKLKDKQTNGVNKQTNKYTGNFFLSYIHVNHSTGSLGRIHQIRHKRWNLQTKKTKQQMQHIYKYKDKQTKHKQKSAGAINISIDQKGFLAESIQLDASFTLIYQMSKWTVFW